MMKMMNMLQYLFAALTTTSLSLSSLPSDCHISMSRLQRFSAETPVVLLDCGCRPQVIVGPSSLEGVVSITTPAQALEYARFFTSHDTFTLFEKGDLVEIAGFGRAATTSDGRFLIPVEERSRLVNLFHEPVVVKEARGGESVLFKIRRVVVGTNGVIYDVEELVDSTGSYALVNRVVLFRNAASIGILHFGPV